MNTYLITYSTISSGTIEIDAASKRNAIEIFACMEFQDIFEEHDILKGIEIEDIEKL